MEVDVDRPEQAVRVLKSSPEFDEVALYGKRLHVVAEEVNRYRSLVRQRLTATGITVRGMLIIPPSLEDVFIARIREEEAKKRQDTGRTRDE